MNALKNPYVIVGGIAIVLVLALMNKGGSSGSGAATTIATENISAQANLGAQKYNSALAVAAMQDATANRAIDTGFLTSVLQTINANNNAQAGVQRNYDLSRAGVTVAQLRAKNAVDLATIDQRTRLALAPIQASTVLSLATIRGQTTEQIMSIQSAASVTIAQANAAAAAQIAQANAQASVDRINAQQGNSGSQGDLNTAASALGIAASLFAL